MSLYRSSGRGSWIVERVLLGVPIRRATGVYDYGAAREVEAALVKLARHGRRDLLQAFDAGHVTGVELVTGLEQFGMTFQFTVERAVLLAPAVGRWLKDVSLAETTTRDYRNGLAALQRRAPRARVADLPVLLARYARRAKPVMFQRVKAAVQSFISTTVPKGRHSELWRDVGAVRGRPAPGRSVQGGLPPATARAVAEALGTFGPMWWTLCCTGMGRKEYWRGRWQVLADRIVVAGTKRAARQRILPRVTTPVRPGASEGAFAKALKGVGAGLCIPRLTIYVARRTFSHLLELARVPDSRCDAYMGHSAGARGMRGLYREHDVAPYLGQDAAAMRAVIGADPVYVRALA